MKKRDPQRDTIQEYFFTSKKHFSAEEKVWMMETNRAILDELRGRPV